MIEKYTTFDYRFFWAVVPSFDLNAFGFWRVWYAQFEMYRFNSQLKKEEVKE